jgi:hypothetical protein
MSTDAPKQPGTPSSHAYFNEDMNGDAGPEIPLIDDDEPFFDVVKKLSEYLIPDYPIHSLRAAIDSEQDTSITPSRRPTHLSN